MAGLVIVGVVRTPVGFRVIDANKKEHECRSPMDLYNCMTRLLEAADLPDVETSGRRRDDVEHDEIKQKIHDSEGVIREYIAQDFGDTIGNVVAKAATKGGSKLFGALRRISRK